MNPICLTEFEVSDLLRNHPPRWRNPHKARIFDRIRAAHGYPPSGALAFSRWRCDLPRDYQPAETRITARGNFFDYQPAVEPSKVAWYLNFAHSELFGFYDGPLLAQDELQVLEHPVLASLRSALLERAGNGEKSLTPWTVEGGEPTPCLVSGAPRFCHLDTGPSPAAPGGLYGNLFAQAGWDSVEKHLKVFNPALATANNILAMEAPPGGMGDYQPEEVRYILSTAHCGFLAARFESARLAGPDASTEIHTGFWGCGAYGGNRVLMVMLQIIAARQAGVESLVVHTGREEDMAVVENAEQVADALGTAIFDDLIADIAAMSFRWGFSDGN